MKTNRLNWLLFTIILMLAGCQQVDENTVEFETFTADKTVALVPDEESSPMCKVSLKMHSATQESGHRGEVINYTVVEHLFHQQEVSIKSAIERFTEDFTHTYRQTMMPLYNQDRNDTTKRSWYDFHYIISTETQKGSEKTLAYLATIDYYEGGAHGTNQLEILNFEAKTGRLMTLKDIFNEGCEEELNVILLNALMESKGVSSLSELKEKGYLVSLDIYAPENFIIGQETITFVYNPSEIAPYTEGGTQLIIPYTALEKILKNSFYSFIK